MTLKNLIIERIKNNKEQIWTPADFIDLGDSEAIKKTLQRLVNNHQLRRIDRGLYDKPRTNALTGKENPPDYRKVIEAVSRRDQVRILIDGMTCANELGLTNAVPGQVLIHTDGRLRPIKLNNLIIKFKLTAPSKLYWADRPGMRIVQALYWLEDTLCRTNEMNFIVKAKLTDLLSKSTQKQEICADLRAGLHTLPIWMQKWLRVFLLSIEESKQENDE
ncbi:TPA: DUF6088 family protein [Legionella pneumophila]|nr:DUF6088 family protein [Legionella pneumophila]HAT1883609.1 hypothetical protein [Legionella pneumophila]HAT2115329.1 hypothetical protein [Legionella pneumophila]HAT8721526.1 hypothetical protein [Legionella pneumophila]